VHSAEGIECVEVFLFLEVCLVKVEGLGPIPFHVLVLVTHRWHRHQHVVDNMLRFAQNHLVRGACHGLDRAYHWIVGHVIHLSIDVLLLISTPVQIRHMVRIIGATLALSGEKEPSEEAEEKSRDARDADRHGELLCAVPAPRPLLDPNTRLQIRTRCLAQQFWPGLDHLSPVLELLNDDVGLGVPALTVATNAYVLQELGSIH